MNHFRTETLTWRISLIASIAILVGIAVWTGVFNNPNQASAEPGWETVTSTPAPVLTMEVTTSDEMIVGTTKGIFRSSDDGKTWREAGEGMGNRPVRAIIVDPENSSRLYVGAWGGVFRSEDNGKTWTHIGLQQQDVTTITFDGESSDVIYAGTARSGVFKSVDSGDNWAPTNPSSQTGLAVQSMVWDSHSNALLIAPRAAEGGKVEAQVQLSYDGGLTWKPQKRGLPNTSVLSLISVTTETTASGVLFAATDGWGVYKSVDGGNTWIAAGSGIPSGARVRTLQTQPNSSAILLAVTDRGVFKTENLGGFWVPLEDRLNGKNVLAIGISARANGPLFAATWHDGIFRFDGLKVAAPTATPIPELETTPEATPTATPEPVRQSLPTDPVDAFDSSEFVWFFPETGHSLSHGFLQYWLTHGGVEQFGMPITEEFIENGTTVQYFERALLEYHPASGDQPERIVIGHLGRIATEGRFFTGVFYIPTTSDQMYFPETGHSTMHGFLRYWRNNGSVERFGFPISEETEENGKIVQYFERARLEFNADKQGTDEEISVGLLGREVLEQRGWLNK